MGIRFGKGKHKILINKDEYFEKKQKKTYFLNTTIITVILSQPKPPI
jgi:hypothetical protein